jgi:hypothetical protein
MSLSFVFEYLSKNQSFGLSFSFYSAMTISYFKTLSMKLVICPFWFFESFTNDSFAFFSIVTSSGTLERLPESCM